MAATNFTLPFSRNLLCKTIIETVNSWPEFQRRTFVGVHYCGKTIEKIAAELNVSSDEARCFLSRAEHQLQEALRVFRDMELPESCCQPADDSNAASIFWCR